MNICPNLWSAFKKKEVEDEIGHAPIVAKIGFTNLVAYFKSSSAFAISDIFSMTECFDVTDHARGIAKLEFGLVLEHCACVYGLNIEFISLKPIL